jgi:tRNA nucleotidyltransferase/poly(A) polymerase
MHEITESRIISSDNPADSPEARRLRDEIKLFLHGPDVEDIYEELRMDEAVNALDEELEVRRWFEALNSKSIPHQGFCAIYHRAREKAQEVVTMEQFLEEYELWNAERAERMTELVDTVHHLRWDALLPYCHCAEPAALDFREKDNPFGDVEDDWPVWICAAGVCNFVEPLDRREAADGK